MSAPTYRQFFEDVLDHLGIEPTHGNLRAFGVIVLIEGRNAYWNPMNWVLPDSYPRFNSTGVREYPDYRTGVRETANNLTSNPRWSPFVKSLTNARTRIGPLRAIAAIYAQWGSFPAWFVITWQQAHDVLNEEMPS